MLAQLQWLIHKIITTAKKECNEKSNLSSEVR